MLVGKIMRTVQFRYGTVHYVLYGMIFPDWPIIHSDSKLERGFRTVYLGRLWTIS